ncbi:glycoside hydrolase family 16 protein [Mycena amicta]|nr:glycoside hydrolase family 16 protein [Mycena amicta]
MVPSTAALGVLAALAASASASHNSFKRMPQHARVAATKRADTVSGTAYWGFQNQTMNACGTYSADADMIIGVGPIYYGDMDSVSDQCFQHITVTLASDSSKSIDVTLTDACQDCGADGNVYLSTAAFAALSGGSLDAGVLDVTWSFVSGSGSSSSSGSGSDSSSSDNTVTTSTEDGTTEKATTTTKPHKTSTKTTTSKTSSSTKAAPTGPSSDGYKLTKKLEGQTFLDFFNYDTGTGDNGGVANYVNGISSGLAYTSNGQVILAVDTEETVSTRQALRLVSKTTFNAEDQNLFIFDVAQIPSVCGTWPAVWMLGPTWPLGGEVDVVEGVSLYNKNIYSIHTGSGCSISSSAVKSMSAVTIVEASGTSCDANVDPGACGFTDDSATTFGPGFNKAGGGVFALQFDTEGIKFWFFQAGSIPSDITDLAPSPSTWGSPKVSIAPSTCDPTTYFKDLMMIVNTNLGGSFTEGLWGVDGAGGQKTSCKTLTGVDTAAEYVQNQGSKFGDDAQWKINGFYIYNQ